MAGGASGPACRRPGLPATSTHARPTQLRTDSTDRTLCPGHRRTLGRQHRRTTTKSDEVEVRQGKARQAKLSMTEPRQLQQPPPALVEGEWRSTSSHLSLVVSSSVRCKLMMVCVTCLSSIATNEVHSTDQEQVHEVSSTRRSESESELLLGLQQVLPCRLASAEHYCQSRVAGSVPFRQKEVRARWMVEGAKGVESETPKASMGLGMGGVPYSPPPSTAD